MNRNRQEKGITLIALVITIIILLILAGVTLNVALGDNGLFQKSKEAVEKSKQAALDEEMKLFQAQLAFENLDDLKSSMISSGAINQEEIEEKGIAPINKSDKLLAISDAKGLRELSKNVKAGNDYNGIAIYLLNDINMGATFNTDTGELLTGESFEPIGDSNSTIETESQDGSKKTEFNGKFLGLNHTISNLYIKEEEENTYGTALFGYVGQNGAVQDLTIKDSYISGNFETGAIVGRNRGTVSNCTNLANIKGNKLTGGISGRNVGTLEKCINRGKIEGFYQTGGVSGNYDLFDKQVKITNCLNYGSVAGEQIHTGGIVGGAFSSNTSNDIIIDNCKNYGEVSSSGNYCGGIAGNFTAMKIEKCSNYGTIFFTSKSKGWGLGGITGYAQSTQHDIYISDCHNEGKIWIDNTGDNIASQAGGIIGNGGNAKIQNCYNIGDVTIEKAAKDDATVGGIAGFAGESSISNCYNIGNLTANSNRICCGICIATKKPQDIKNNYWLDTCGATNGKNEYGVPNSNSNEGAEPKTSDELKSLASILGNAYAQSDTINNGYPYLKNNVPTK